MQFKIFLFCILLSIPASAQVMYTLGNEAANTTRLEKELRETTDDSIRANLSLKLSIASKRGGDIAGSKKYLQQAVDLGTKYPFVRAALTYYKPMVEYVPGDIAALERNLLAADSVLQPFTQAEAFRIRGILWNNYGIIQQMKNDEKGALDAFANKAARYAGQSGDFTIQGKAYKNMSIVFMNANQREKAATYLRQAMEALKKSSDDPLNPVELMETYIIAGENYVYLQELDSAKAVLDKAREALRPYPSSNLYLIFYFAEGACYDKLERYAQAIQSFDKGIATATRLASPYPLNRLLYAKYKTLSNQKEYRKAAAVMEELVKSPLVFTTDKKIYYQALYTTYSRLGQTSEAFRWAERYIVLSDSLYEAKFQKDIVELESKYNKAENEKKITSLQAEQDKTRMESRNTRLLIWLLGTMSLFLSVSVFFGVVVYKQKSAQHRQTLKDTEQKQQIQLAKALLQGEEQERKRLAIDLHDGLGGQLAGIKINLSRMTTHTGPLDTDLLKVIEQLDVSSNELRRIARNMMPESLLLLGLESALKDMCESLGTDRTQVVFQPFGIGPEIPRETQVNIYRIVQELLTNAIRHASASEILVQCSQNGSRFFITLEDNGKGFIPEQNGQKGIGLNNVRSRVSYLKGKLDISSAPQEGTTINIEFDVTA